MDPARAYTRRHRVVVIVAVVLVVVVVVGVVVVAVVVGRTLGVTKCDISHIRSTFTYVNEQALVMLNGWMTSRHRRHGNDASPANELARALTCIKRDDVVNAYLSDVITKCPRRDSATYADKGLYMTFQCRKKLKVIDLV